MKSLVSYLLEYRCDDVDEIQDRATAISADIREWLCSKKVSDPDSNSGTFVSLTKGQSGAYSRKVSEVQLGRVEEIVLIEPANDDQLFQTSISVGVCGGDLAVYANLSARSKTSIVSPVNLNQKCPKVIRGIVKKYADWKIGGFEVGDSNLTYINDRDRAFALTTLIRSKQRRLPIILISEIEGETIWKNCGKELAFDLAGLARVFEIGEEASWVLTEQLGKLSSCYLGAIRLYWPIRDSIDRFLPGRVWTASTLLSNDYDSRGMDRFIGYLRREIMDVAALTVELPKQFRDLRSLAARERLVELEKRATDSAEVLELATAYANENDSLKEEVEGLKSEIHRLVLRAESAEDALLKKKESEGISGSTDGQSLSECEFPRAGEIRFYKKMHSKPSYDLLVRVADCGHNSWQGAHKADKAKKGLERLEHSTEWRSILHCGKCTGGGMWKVQW